MTLRTYDLVVLGSGAGGSTPASECRRAGWRVAVVDDQPFGGTCALRGCDPKKVLVGVAHAADESRRLTGFGIDGDVRIDWAALEQFKHTFTDPVPAARERALEKQGIDIYHGRAQFVAQDTLAVGTETLRAKHFVIATGAIPRPLGISGEEHVRTSTDFLALETLPESIVFIGAGYIAFEFAHVASRVGARVTMLGRGKPLHQFDEDVVRALVEHTRRMSVDFQSESEVVAVEQRGDHLIVNARGPSGEACVEAALVVHGAGRVPDTQRLDTDAAHIELDERGGVRVNQFLQSVSNPGVYAAGDATLPKGSMPLTPVASHEGAVVTANLLHGNTRTPNYAGIPSVVFTIPALATVGVTEAAARNAGMNVRVNAGQTGTWYSQRRLRETTGMFKTIVDQNTDRIVGAHLLGPSAEEVINIFALAIRYGLTAAALREMIYSYPTRSSDIAYML